MAYPSLRVRRLVYIVPFQGHLHTPPGWYSRWDRALSCRIEDRYGRMDRIDGIGE